MSVYQTIDCRREPDALCFGNGVLTLRFSAQSGSLECIDFGSERLILPTGSSEIALLLDGRYDAAERSNVGGEFLHPEDALSVGETRFLAYSLERGVSAVTLTILCQCDAGRLEKRYTLSSEEDQNVIARGFSLVCARALRLDEAALCAPMPENARAQSVGTHDAHMLLSDAATLLLWAGAYRDDCSTVKIENGTLTHRVYLCTSCEAGETIRFGEDFIAVTPGGAWREAADCLRREHDAAGLICANPMRRAFGRMAIYEAMIGEWDIGEKRLARYACVSELVADLDRIAGMGFTVVQLMPSMPFPSYTVQDLSDLCMQNAGGEDITPLVKGLHARGMRLIMDIVLHGVYDVEACEKCGRPIPPRYREGGYPERHKYRDEHPDWFLHGDDGEIVRTYTWSFDHASEGWQKYVCDSLEGYVRKYDVDGFRFDALEWSQTPDCASGQKHSGGAHLRRGNYDLYRKLRARIDAIKPDILWMDENPHIYLTDLMYACYGGDTPFMLEAVRRGEHTARELQMYLALRTRVFPSGFSIVQYGENHDIAQAKKGVYLTEAHGEAYARLMMAFGAMAGGPFMCFMGGDEGYEDYITSLIALRDRFPSLWLDGHADFETATCEDPGVACVLRAWKNTTLLGVFNTAATPVCAQIGLDGTRITGKWRDVLNGETFLIDGGLSLEAESFHLLERL